MDSINILQDITPQQFLKEYWEKKPLLIRQALPQASNYIDKELMRELAFEEEVESRFLFIDEKQNFFLHHNPITPTLLERYQEGTWTLINHGVNLFHRPMWELQKSVQFIPQWNFDDIMVTHSSVGGTVGPHIDSYNVFIIQGHGKKRWQLNSNPDPAIIPEQQVKILANFSVEQEYVLEEGDMLYLPPQVAHYGVSLTEGMSYSLGFNSVKPSSLIDRFVQNLQQQYEDDDIFSLPFKQTKNPWNYTPHVERQFQKLLAKECSTENIADFIRQELSTPRYWPTPNEHIAFEDFLTNLSSLKIYRDPFLKFFTDGTITLFVNSQPYHFTSKSDLLTIVKWLNNFPMDPLPQIENLTLEGYQHLYALYLTGAIFFGLK